TRAACEAAAVTSCAPELTSVLIANLSSIEGSLLAELRELVELARRLRQPTPVPARTESPPLLEVASPVSLCERGARVAAESFSQARANAPRPAVNVVWAVIFTVAVTAVSVM